MRVLHVINSLAPGGAERLVATLLPRLREEGVDAGLYALDGRGDVFSEKLAARGVPVVFARREGADVYSPARITDLRRCFEGLKPDIVHAHLGPSFHWCALAAASLGRRAPRLAATEHSVHNRRMRAPLLRGFERWCYRRYDRVACVSEEVAQALRAWLKLPADMLPVVFNGVEAQDFAAGAAPDAALLAWAAGRKVVAMTARFVPAKDHATALAAVALLPADYAAVFIGDGPERGAALAQAQKLGIAGRCSFLGARDDVPALLAACDLYMQTSLSEGFGIACLEAMAAGLPVAASAVGGLRPLVEGAGLLFPPGDARACAAALQTLSEDSAAREKTLAAQALRVRRHSMQAAARAYFRLYTEIMEVST